MPHVASSAALAVSEGVSERASPPVMKWSISLCGCVLFVFTICVCLYSIASGNSLPDCQEGSAASDALLTVMSVVSCWRAVLFSIVRSLTQSPPLLSLSQLQWWQIPQTPPKERVARTYPECLDW